jgi:low temperature requirement protein LtrA
MTQRSALRRLWQPPARFEDRPRDRRVTFLELFFDLVFVVVIAELAHRLSEHVSWSGVGWFAFLFFAVWSSWINGTLYHDLHPTDDVSVRVFTFAQMLAVAVMAVYVGDVPGQGSTGFALAYAANTLILVVLWFRTGLHDPAHRPASVPYSTAYLISAALFALSVGVDEPARYWLWALALLAEIAGFIIAIVRWTPPASQGGDAAIATTPSLIERMGLFVIIVLGEVVVGAVTGMAEVRHLGANGIVLGLLGVIVAIGLWWLYFDLVSHRAPVSRYTQLWLYLHLPMVMAIAVGGAGVLNTVEHASESLPVEVRWLLVGALAVALASITLITLVLEFRARQLRIYRTVDLAMLVSAALIVGVGITHWEAKATLGAMAALLLLPVGAGLLVFLKSPPPSIEGREDS